MRQGEEPMKLMTCGIVLAALVALAPAARAQSTAPVVDLELVLAVDVSRSMDMSEQALQRQGYAAAFRHPEVIGAIRSGALGRIAVTYIEWAGVANQWQTVPWMTIAGEEDAASFAAAILAAPPRSASRTSISDALGMTSATFGAFNGYRRAIDVSGDGANNAGGPVAEVRDRLVRQDITINGLPIMLHPNGGPFPTYNLDGYYRDCVIGGPGAFMVTVKAPEEFAPAIRRKLVLEISGLPARIVPAADTDAPAATADCLMGEKQWMQRFDFQP
jgi:hypothetical protein